MIDPIVYHAEIALRRQPPPRGSGSRQVYPAPLNRRDLDVIR